jgi:hypothetical protein
MHRDVPLYVPIEAALLSLTIGDVEGIEKKGRNWKESNGFYP